MDKVFEKSDGGAIVIKYIPGFALIPAISIPARFIRSQITMKRFLTAMRRLGKAGEDALSFQAIDCKF